MTEREPTSEEIRKFLLVFDVLDGFEAMSAFNRGYGAFQCERPIAEVVVVRDWLRSKADVGALPPTVPMPHIDCTTMPFHPPPDEK